MKSFKIVPQLRENCAIQGPEEFLSDIRESDIIFLLKNTPTKKYSIITKVDALKIDEDPIIFIDKRILGNFGENEEVRILKYYPAEAKELILSVSTQYGIITKGEWTKVLKSPLRDKLLDYGKEITFMVPWEGGAPIVVSGIVNTTMPNPPVYVGDNTRIFVEKFSEENLSEIKKEAVAIQENRVEILEKEQEENILSDLRVMKHKNYPNIGQKYKFKATNPKKIFKTVMNIFKGLNTIEKPLEQAFDEEGQDYFASVVFLLNEGPEKTQLIDIQVLGYEKTGSLMLYVTGKTEEIIEQTLEKYDKLIKDIKEDIEPKIELLQTKCAGCGADLPLKEIDIEGYVKCKFCRNVSKIPKVLRY